MADKKFKPDGKTKVTREDYKKYKENFKPGNLAKPLTFSDYKSLSEFYGENEAKRADLELVMKGGIAPARYKTAQVRGRGERGREQRSKVMSETKLNKGGVIKANAGASVKPNRMTRT